MKNAMLHKHQLERLMAVEMHRLAENIAHSASVSYPMLCDNDDIANWRSAIDEIERIWKMTYADEEGEAP